ncbi:MAG: LysM peptidoglycan-binding domain-containing protein [Candidatus Daviesbacteria bacterium]
MPRIKKSSRSFSSGISNLPLIQRLQKELNLDQSYLSLILGVLIVLIVGVLIFNYLKRGTADIGPAQQTTAGETIADVAPENLPGKYTIKDGDTLFMIAEKYYQDGYKYLAIATANKLANVDYIEAGQVIDIPKLEEVTPTPEIAQTDQGMGGAENQTIWGEAIKGDTYTVVEGDWLSKIAGRAYGDIMAYDKIAQVNNIPNPDLIEPGQVLNIPR